MNWISLFSLVNQVAIVTGAAGGLGQQLVNILLDAGANVILVDIDEKKLKQFAHVIDPQNQKTLVQTCDITRKENVINLIDAVHKKFGKIDILVNCAGVLGADSFMFEVKENEWDNVININLKATWMVSTEVSRYMIKHAIKGKIINISSSLGLRSQLKRIAYATSKAGVEHLTRNMAMELVQHNIRVNCLAPGWLNSDMVKEILNGPDGDKWRKTIPMRRAAEPHELAGSLLLLASDASSYMTGNIVRVDGGYAYCGIELPE